METISQLSRRKACDLCFVKKIKCDMMKPQCSNCKQYSTDCKTTAVRRRIGRPKIPRQDTNNSAETDSPDELEHAANSQQAAKIQGLESRLSRIEEQLQQVLSVATAALASANRIPAPSGTRALTMGTSSWEDSDLDNCIPVRDTLPFPASSTTDTSGPSASSTATSSPSESIIRSASPNLPPLAEILPIINTYFSQINNAIPLFSQSEFMRMLHEWYTYPARRTRAVWAAVNIVLALGSWIPTTPIQDANFAEAETAFRGYMNNAQSVLVELVTREQDLLGLQTLLGLVILYQTLANSKQGAVLIGAAVRLVHRLQMQSKNNIEVMYPAEQGLQRCRLFWIAYMLDKEISLKHHTPSIQHDADIDQDLPSSNPTDGVGDIYTTDGLVRVNYFRLRVRLAHIQGRAYDMLYSTRSTKISMAERQMRVIRLTYLLENWRSSIPPQMLPDAVTSQLGRTDRLLMLTLYGSFVGCMVMVHGVWSQQAAWMKIVSDRSLMALQDSRTDERLACINQQPPLPSAWKRCVQISREFSRSLMQQPESDINIWANLAPVLSSLVILLTNIYQSPGHGDLEEDRQITQWLIRILDKAKQLSVLVPLSKMLIVVTDLSQRAEAAVEKAQRKRKALQERLLMMSDQGFWNQEAGQADDAVDENVDESLLWDTEPVDPQLADMSHMMGSESVVNWLDGQYPQGTDLGEAVS
ncbi:fungal-specific transcription factor domain-containing protein [Triangularia verruculosa]|uniref:Fungal-specific transcription factor domain-containing protein n=1 Tax=Triangularia verruculosa TaxID=2587418 RepID=A0AAN7B249_9PEZI|nr:fungal-specific transcription factor domain-containing protein [Triangularia verruculosa]